MSTEAQQHLEASVPDGVAVRDLGEHGHVEYDDGRKRHPYVLVDPGGGKRHPLDRVTRVLSGAVPSDGLIRWAEKAGAAGTIEAIRRGELDPATVEPAEAVNVVRALKLGADGQKNQAADRGLSVHAAAEHWAVTGDLPPVTELAMEARPFLQGLARFLVSHDPTPVEVERIVCHPGELFAGRFDLLCEIDGFRARVDYKSRPKLAVYEKDCLQLAAYGLAEDAVGEEPVVQSLVVAIGVGGGFRVQPATADPRDFLAALAWFRTLKRVRQPLAAADRAAKKAAEA